MCVKRINRPNKMMNVSTKKIAVFRHGLWILPLLLLCFACSKDDDSNTNSNSNNNSKPFVQNHELSISLSSNALPTNVLMPVSDVKTTENWGYVMKSDERLSLFAKQDGKVIFLAALASSVKQTSSNRFDIALGGFDSLANANGKPIKEVVESVYEIDFDKPFEIMGGTCFCNNSENDVFYHVTLTRSEQTGIWFHFNGKYGAMTSDSHLAGTHEALFVVNKTSSPITFTHKGFNVDKKWYSKMAKVSLISGEVKSLSEYGDESSNAVEVSAYKAGDYAKRINSFYVPNGNKIQDAQLVAEINGKEVRSVNRISSDVTLELGKSYGMVAVWDGENLTLGEVNGDGVIKLPEGANVKVDDITVMGDGQEVTVGANGTFSTEANALIAYGKDDKLLYINLLSTDTEGHEHKPELNALQTAITMLLPALPNIFDASGFEGFTRLKEQIGALPETATLAKAIDQSIVRRGHLEVDDVSNEYSAALNKLKTLLGLNKNYLKPASRKAYRASRRNTPVALENGTLFKNKQGIRIDLNDSQWDKKSEQWELTLTAYSERLAYSAINVVDVMPDGTQFPMYDGLEVLKYLVKPMSPKSFVDKFTSLDGLGNYFSDTYKFFTEEDFELDDMTFDMQKASGILLKFGTPSVQLQVIAPKDNSYLLTYQIVLSFVKPLMSFIGGKAAKAIVGDGKELEDEVMQDVMKDLMSAGMIEKTARDVLEGKTKDLGDVYDFVVERVKKYFEKWLFNWPQLVASEAVETAMNNILFFKKVAFEILDFTSGYMGIGMCESYCVDLHLDFEESKTGGSIVDVPGSDF